MDTVCGQHRPTHTYIHVLNTHTRARMHTHIQTHHIHTHTYRYTHTYVHTHIPHTHVHVCTHTPHTHTHVCTHIPTHLAPLATVALEGVEGLEEALPLAAEQGTWQGTWQGDSPLVEGDTPEVGSPLEEDSLPEEGIHPGEEGPFEVGSPLEALAQNKEQPADTTITNKHNIT